jgi:signal transduction histidine kinase
MINENGGGADGSVGVLSPSTATLTRPHRSVLRQTLGARLPLAFVLISLALSVVLPRLTLRRIIRLRNEISSEAEPARLRLMRIQLNLAREAVQRRGFLLTGDQEVATQLAASRTDRLIAEDQLLRFVRALDGPTSPLMTRGVMELHVLDGQLDSLVTTSPVETAAAVDEQHRAFVRIQSVVDTVAGLIDAAVAGRRRTIDQTNNEVALLSIGLMLLALGAAMMVGQLGTRERVAREIAERRQVELERVTDSRGRLVRGFTHDVKNPLGAADGYLALLEEGVLGTMVDGQRAAIQKVRRSIRQALDLIGQLLAVARAEAGQLTIHRRETDITEVIREAADGFLAQATTKGLRLVAELPGQGWSIETDPALVRQVIGNLVTNAVKYTPRGGRIVLSLDRRANPGPERRQQMLIIVADNGPGIAADKLPVLFDEFTRFDPAAADGAGIGMAISQRVAHALGGEITVDSKVGVGTTFVLHLPGPSSEESRAALATSPAAQ